MKLIAVTGGIGAGKSTVTSRLRRLGAEIIDADATARRVVEPRTPIGSAVLAQIVALLGPKARHADGELDRDRVAALVFNDAALRERYNAIIHPAIMRATADEIGTLQDSGAIIVHEIPLLTANTPPLPWRYDLVVTVEAAAQERIRRLQQHRGYTAAHAAARVSAQGPEDARASIADIVLRTDGSLEDTQRMVDELWDRLTG